MGHAWPSLASELKTKLGLSATQVIALSPEFDASVAIVLCALHRGSAHVEALDGTPDYREWWHAHFPRACDQLHQHLEQMGLNAEDYIPLPVHPWQAQKGLPHAFAEELADNLLVITDIVAFIAQPTMSFRTVLPEASQQRRWSNYRCHYA